MYSNTHGKSFLETRYEGVWMHEILKRAGLQLDESRRGNALTTYRLVAPHDKSGARSVRMLTKLEIVQLGK